MAEVVRPGMAATPIRNPPSAFAEVQQQPDGVDLNLESLLPSDLTFAIEFAQPAKPSKPPAYKPTALPTQLLQPSTSAVIPPNNPWSYDPLDAAGRANSTSQNPPHQHQQLQPLPLLMSSRSVPDRAVYSSYHHLNYLNHNHFNNCTQTSTTPSTAGAAASPRPMVNLAQPPPPLPPPPPPPRGGANPCSPSLPSLLISSSGPVRVSSSSSSNPSPRQSPAHSRSGNSDYGSGASHEDYYAIGQPPPPPPRDSVAATAAVAARTADGAAGQRGPGPNRSFVRRNSAGSGSNYTGATPPLPPPPPPPRDGSPSHPASYCPPLDLGALTTAAVDGSVVVTQSSRGGGGSSTPTGPAGADCWPPPPPPPQSKNSTPRPAGAMQPLPPPPPPPPRTDSECLRSRSSNSSTATFNLPYANGYPHIVPPPPPPPRRSPGAGPTADGLHAADATAAAAAIGSDGDAAAGFKVPTVQEAQMLVAAALQDGTDSSLAAALELSSKLQSLAAHRIAASQPGKPSSPHSPAASGCARSPSPLGGANGRGSFTGQCAQQLPPVSPVDNGRLASLGSGTGGLYSRASNTPRTGCCYVPPPPPPPRYLSSGSGMGSQTVNGQASSPLPPPPPPPRAPIPQPPSADVAAVMAALPEVRSPFALYQRTPSDDDDCCPTPPDETALLQEQLQQLSHIGTSPPCGFGGNNSTSAAASAVAAAAVAAASVPFGNSYTSLFGVNAMTPAAAPYGSSISAFTGAGAVNAGSLVSGAFGSDVFGAASIASSAPTAASAASSGFGTEVSLASLTSLLTTLAVLAKQGGGGAAATTSLGTGTMPPDAVAAAMANSTTAVSCSDPSGPGTPAAKAVTPTDSLSVPASPDVPISVSPANVSLAGSDDMSVVGESGGGAAAAVLSAHAKITQSPPVSQPASTIALDVATSEVTELVTTAAGASAVPSPRDFTLSAPVSDCIAGGPSLAALQQALALLAGEVSVAAAPLPPPPLPPPPPAASADPADLCSAALSLPGLTVTPQELQMARSLAAALKVVALLDSLSGGAAAGCQSAGFRV